MSLERRKFILKESIRGKSTWDIQISFKRHFKVSSAPSRSTITSILEKFEKTGSVHDQGQPLVKARPVRSDEKIEEIRELVEITPTKSIREVASDANIGETSTQRILRHDLQLYPYRVTLLHKLNQDDPEKRLLFCDWFCRQVGDYPGFIDNLFVSDESTFHLNGVVHSQNFRVWGQENPQRKCGRSARRLQYG